MEVVGFVIFVCSRFSVFVARVADSIDCVDSFVAAWDDVVISTSVLSDNNVDVVWVRTGTAGAIEACSRAWASIKDKT